MVDTRTDYSADAVAAARAVMLEQVRLLGEYRDEIVIVRGWVPELLLPLAQPGHIGSTDVDLALDHRRITEAGHQTIRIGAGPPAPKVFFPCCPQLLRPTLQPLSTLFARPHA